MRAVGPIDFQGPAVEREKLVKEEFFAGPEISIEEWLANIERMQPEMDAADEALFALLRGVPLTEGQCG